MVVLEQIKATRGSSRPACGLGDLWGVTPKTKTRKVEADYGRLAGDQKTC